MHQFSTNPRFYPGDDTVRINMPDNNAEAPEHRRHDALPFVRCQLLRTRPQLGVPYYISASRASSHQFRRLFMTHLSFPSRTSSVLATSSRKLVYHAVTLPLFTFVDQTASSLLSFCNHALATRNVFWHKTRFPSCKRPPSNHNHPSAPEDEF